MPSRRIVPDVNEEARDVARALATTEEFEQSRHSRSALRCYLLTSSASCGSAASDCVGRMAATASVRCALRHPLGGKRESAELRQQLLERGGDGQLHDIQVFVAEDRRTVMVFADWSTDEPVYTTFPLDEPNFRYQYDRPALVEWFQSSEVAH
jgi:hypothetical protein